ncbi:hypothetical protein HXA34_20080 [Salipaludibacillus agaradhaerens]|jgi:DNA-binding CsgD family transcriptional regulator|uniref:DNA-directed RNA polymerase subunit alpha C-terminal domain-containing protein n=1 Tax=Salipaludibacillus agaradhaerens TaxID=76935 RepID=UPI002151B7FC|nr:DNA-directed RNA polymerase subunit alpha C-terminal domain-containing protein [Salipaludibacillus agaradhaerens]MCR6108590.1 hypothetical protein [Salipaludibacillus agaradhaerens]MCR6120619.1 hypothetical protein [Salipaludibacillus agaradhaerens]
MNNSEYPFNLIRAIYRDQENDTTHTQTVHIKRLYQQMLTLSEREQKVLSLRFRDRLTLKATGERVGISGQQVRYTQNKALRKLKHPSRSKFYETIPKFEMDRLEEKYREVQKDNARLRETLGAIGISDIDPHVLILLARMVKSEDLNMHVGKLGLSTRIYNGLARAGIHTISQLIATPDEELINMRNIGERSLQELKSKIKTYILLDSHRDEWGLAHEGNPV